MADRAQIEAVNIPWHKVGCILEAVAKFVACESTGGQACIDNLVTDIRRCLGVRAPAAANR